MEQKLRSVMQYTKHTVLDSGVIDVSFKSDYEYLGQNIVLASFLNQNIYVKAQIPPDNDMEIGEMSLKSLNIDRGGDQKIIFTSIVDSVDIDNINIFATTEKGTDIIMYLECDIDEEDTPDDEDYELDPRDNESWGDDDENDMEDWD